MVAVVSFFVLWHVKMPKYLTSLPNALVFSGCVMCTSSGAISCSPSSDCETCECSCSPGYYRNESSSTLSCKPGMVKFLFISKSFA